MNHFPVEANLPPNCHDSNYSAHPYLPLLSPTSLLSLRSVNPLEETGQMKQDRLDATSLDDILEDQLLNRLKVLPKNSDTSHYQRYRATRKACRYLWGGCKTDKDCCSHLWCRGAHLPRLGTCQYAWDWCAVSWC